MRIAVIAAVFLSCIAGAAIAQNAAQPAIQWQVRPEAREFGQAYPRRARDENVAGYSLLCCTVLPNRRLSCEVAAAWPNGYGFDRAGRDVVQQFRMTEESYAEWPGGDARIRRGVVWRMGATTPELDAALAQIHEATKATCTPPGTEVSPGRDDITITGVALTVR